MTRVSKRVLGFRRFRLDGVRVGKFAGDSNGRGLSDYYKISLKLVLEFERRIIRVSWLIATIFCIQGEILDK